MPDRNVDDRQVPRLRGAGSGLGRGPRCELAQDVVGVPGRGDVHAVGVLVEAVGVVRPVSSIGESRPGTDCEATTTGCGNDTDGAVCSLAGRPPACAERPAGMALSTDRRLIRQGNAEPPSRVTGSVVVKGTVSPGLTYCP